MTFGRQLALDLGHRTAVGREDFLVARCNADAVAWLDRWPDWPAPGLVVHGPAGCGKTHLAHAWRAVSGAGLVAGRDLDPGESARLGGALVVDRGDEAPDEEAFLHLVNVVGERGGHVLITARSAPARWPIGLPDLRSRLNALPAVAVGPPDDAVVAAVLVKMFADRQLRVGEEVIWFLVARMERSFAAAGRLVERLDAAALATRRRITVPLARRVLGEIEAMPKREGEETWI